MMKMMCKTKRLVVFFMLLFSPWLLVTNTLSNHVTLLHPTLHHAFFLLMYLMLHARWVASSSIPRNSYGCHYSKVVAHHLKTR